MLGLKLPTDPRWVNIAEKSIEEILVDHAYCEQKAATSCITIIVSNPERTELVDALIPIVTEEWLHFEMVLKELKKRNYKELVNLTCRANLASGSNSLNAGILSKKSFILKKIMKKFKDKRIHINDCIRFYKKTDFKKLYLEDGILKRNLHVRKLQTIVFCPLIALRPACRVRVPTGRSRFHARRTTIHYLPLQQIDCTMHHSSSNGVTQYACSLSQVVKCSKIIQ